MTTIDRHETAMTDFFRFPHTPHLVWLGKDAPRDDKVLSQAEGNALLQTGVVVEEKLDGANLGFSIDAQGQLQVQNRGQYLTEPYTGQFSRLVSWLGQHRHGLADHLDSGLILFGEWCAARHSLDYQTLPDWFLVFDVYERTQQQFWSTQRRNALAEKLGLAHVPELFRGHATVHQLTGWLTQIPSRYRAGPLEGFVVRQESVDACQARAKVVCADFTQAIGEHWRKRSLEWNQRNMRPPS
jgi:ATP-dependent RNA circularization protein (DNA/RNA ligase family)